MRTLLLATLLAAPATAAEFNPNHLFIARAGTGVLEYDSSGNLIDTFPVVGSVSVEFGPDGHMYLPGNGVVVEVDSTGTTVQTFADASLGFPDDVGFGGGGQLYVADYNGDYIVVFDRNGTFVKTIGNSTDSDTPSGITVGPDGHIWVACHDPGTIVEFDPNGTVIKTIGGGYLTTPRELTFGPDGMLYAADGATIRRIDPSTGASTSSTNYANAWGIAFGSDGYLRVSDHSGFFDILSWDSVNGFQSLDRISVAGTSTTAGLACGPYRFAVNLKGRYNASSGSYSFKEKGYLTYVPGTSAVFLDFEPGSAFFSPFSGHGLDGVDTNGKARQVFATEVSDAPTVWGFSSLTLNVKGKTGPDGFFKPKTFTGTVARAGAGVSIQAKVVSKKILK